MSQLLSLGAINKLTGEYVYPKIANKKDEYICPECNKDLILAQGEIRVHHFRHKVDSINPCHHYSNPNESQIHKDAQMLMKKLLENKTHIQFIRECVSCKKSVELNLPEITEGSIISLEHRFNYNDELKIADVAHTLNNEIKSIYEICNTHKTCSENRPEPWVEINANSLLTSVNTKENEPLIINCIRNEECDECFMNDVIKNIFENIKNNKFIITTKQESIFAPNFPDTTKLITCEPEESEISMCSDIIVDCGNNFNSDEKEVINKFNINNIEDLIRNNKISKNDKQRCLKCLNYVRQRYGLMGIEPSNGHNVIQLEKYAISIRILPDGIIKYCNSLGEKNTEDFTIIGFAYQD